uniref:Ig-like domain-containing protein n=1 Tax=Oreochromis niloticus TaxID=8128 RepID=A0A669ECD0_ORENI
MAGTLIFLLVSSLLQGALCGTFNIKMPQNINVLRGSCVTIPCSFDVESRFEKYLDHTCKAYWSDSPSFTSINAKLKPTKDMTGDLIKKDCSTTFINTNLLQRSKYYIRLECNNALKYSFSQAGVDVSFIAVPPSPTLTPSTLEVKEGTLVSLMCSAPAPCWSHPPALRWTPNRGQSWETLQEHQDKTKVKTSVMSFTASHLHHGNKISCTAVYRKQDGSPDVTAETSLIPVISYSPKDVRISVSPSGPIREQQKVTLTCSSNANPAVENYAWYRAGRNQETLIGTGRTLNVAVSTINSIFFCKATNKIGVKQSSNLQIDVQYSPKDVRISVSPSGPIVEHRKVTLTCSSNANPAVENYAWYRAGRNQETLIGTGRTLNVAVSTINSIFFCKATNKIGVEQSSNLQIDVQYSPKDVRISVSPTGPIVENRKVTLTCSSNANPAVENYTWYRADGDEETLIGTGRTLNVAVSTINSIFFCKVTNTLGFERSSNLQIDVQYSPKNITVSVSPSGPVPENSNMTLTCSSNANPAVRNYTWYRADGDQETFIGTGSSFNVTVSKVKSSFFCKATNALGCERSSKLQIDVQYSPKNITVSVSPSGPVPENSNMTLTCSSDANPAVRNYTWYRADGNQETFIGTGMSSSIKVSRDTQALFCKAENEIGVGRSRNMQIEVQYPPQILLSSHCSSTQSQLNCSCETLGNPSPTIQWYLNELPVNHSKCEIFNETLNRTILRSFFTLNQPHKKDHLTLLCRSFNSLGSASQQFCVSSQQISTEHRLLYPAIISTLAVLLLALLLYVFFIRVQKNPCKNKGHLTDENNTTATSQPLTEEGNEEPSTTEECIYANADGLRRAENLHPANIAGPSSTDLPSSGPKNAEGGCKKSDKKGNENELIYSNVNWKTKSKKKKGGKSLDMNLPGRSYLKEKCMVRGFNRKFVSNAVEMGGLYAQVEPRNMRKEVGCEYVQVKFKEQSTMQK